MKVIPPEETHYSPQADGRNKVMSDHDTWLAQVQEETLEPDLPIIDPHHHLWHFKSPDGEHRYLLEDLLEDTGSGHNIVATVFIECSAMWRADGPEEMKVVGETEFVNGIAAMSASGIYGDTRVAAGIVGTADLNVGARIGEVLDEHLKLGGDRFRGIRLLGTNDPHPEIRNGYNDPARRYVFKQWLPRRLCGTRKTEPDLRGLVFPSSNSLADRPRQGLSKYHHDPRPLRWADRHWPLCRQAG